MKKFINCNHINFDYKLYDDESNTIGWIVFVCENKLLNDIYNMDSDSKSNSNSEYDTDDFINEIKIAQNNANTN